jgi:hypothetical protein
MNFKPLVGVVGPVRINQQYQALVRRRGSLMVWLQIGRHADYGELLNG